MSCFWTRVIVRAITCCVRSLLFLLLYFNRELIFNRRLTWRTRTVNFGMITWIGRVRKLIVDFICMLSLSEVLHELESLVLLVNVDLLVMQLSGILVLLFVNTLALSVETLLVLALLVVYVLLKTTVHFQSRVEPVFDGVVSSAGHVFGNK